MLVDTASATHGRHWETGGHYVKPMQRTHSDLVKFSLRDDDYITVLQYLSEFADNACDVVKKRFPVDGVESSFLQPSSLFRHVDGSRKRPYSVKGTERLVNAI